MTPEKRACQEIDLKLMGVSWGVQDRTAVTLAAGRGITVREVSLMRGRGETDYHFFADGKAIGWVEAKPEEHTLLGVEEQSSKHLSGVSSGPRR